MAEQLVVGAFVVLALAGGLTAALSKQILYNIIGLGVSLFGVAGIFLYLGSPFVAAMQLLIYIGGIVVAIVFAMMLSIAVTVDPPARHGAKTAFAALGSLGLLGGLFVLLQGATFPRAAPAPEEAWGVDRIGAALLDHYNLVFEALSVVLLLAIIGAILIARRDKVAS